MNTTYRAPIYTEDDGNFSPNQTFNEISFGDDWKKHRSKEYFEYRKSWDKIPREKTETKFPIHLDIETTTNCNLKCPMCPRTVMIENGTFGNDSGYIIQEDYMNIVDQGVQHGVKSIKLNYLGEPLLHKDIIDHVRYAKNRGVLDVLMNTNGTALTPKNSRNLLEAGIDGVFV